MIINQPPTLPKDAIEGAETMLDQLQMIGSMLNDLEKRNNDVAVEKKKIFELTVELNLIKDLLKQKFQQYELINLEVLFKHFPRLVRDEDKAYYTTLTNVEPVVTPIADQNLSIELEKDTILFQRNFTCKIKSEYIEEIFAYLVNNQYISSSSSIDTFNKFMLITAIPTKNRIVWIDKASGRSSLKVLCRLFDWAFDELTQKKHFKVKPGYFLTRYFKTIDGDFNENSVAPLLNEVRKVEIPNNPREVNIDLLMKKIYLESL